MEPSRGLKTAHRYGGAWNARTLRTPLLVPRWCAHILTISLNSQPPKTAKAIDTPEPQIGWIVTYSEFSVTWSRLNPFSAMQTAPGMAGLAPPLLSPAKSTMANVVNNMRSMIPLKMGTRLGLLQG